MSASIIAIVPAAGVGARASRPGHETVPKQYRPLSGQPMLRHAVCALLARDAPDATRLLQSHILESQTAVRKITLHRLYSTRRVKAA